jgi:hypothetical protein
MRKALMAVLTLCLTFSWSGSSLADEDRGGRDRRIFPPSSHPFGVSYAEWEGAFQTWLNEIPTPENPLVDPSSARNCEVDGPVVYLGPSGADCRVQEGKALLLPDGFWECSTAEGLGETFRALRRCAVENFARDLGREVVSLTLRIDGKRVFHPRRWTFLTPGEIITFPDDNIWGAPGGPTKSVTKGIIWILRPLREGRHTIRLHVVDQVFGTFDIIWKLRVVD